MKLSSIWRCPGLVKGSDISTGRTLVEADLNRAFQVTGAINVTVPTPANLKAQQGDVVMLFNSSVSGAAIVADTGASFLNHSGNIPLTPGVLVMLIAYSTTAWTIVGVVPATLAELSAGTDVKKFINPKEHLSFHQADITKLAGIAAGANLYVHPNHGGDVTSVADGAQTIVGNAVTNAKLADVATGTIKGRVTASTGDPEDLSATQVRTLLNVADGAEVNQNAFSNVAVSGQTTVAADGKTDTLTLVAGTNITITTDAANDTVTINAATIADATESAAGKVELATTTEASTGTDTVRAVTPAGATAAINARAVKIDHGHGNVGSLCFAAKSLAQNTTLADAGATVSGSDIQPACVVAGVLVALSGVALTGTWRCLGYCRNSQGSTYNTGTLFQRIA